MPPTDTYTLGARDYFAHENRVDAMISRHLMALGPASHEFQPAR